MARVKTNENSTELNLDISSEEPKCEDRNPQGLSYDDLLLQLEQQNQLIELQKQHIENLELQSNNPLIEDHASEVDPEDEEVAIWVSSDAPHIVKQTGYDEETGEAYQYFTFTISRTPKGSHSLRMEKHNIPLDQATYVPRFVYNALNEGSAHRASLVQTYKE